MITFWNLLHQPPFMQIKADKAIRVPGMGRQEQAVLLFPDRGVYQSFERCTGHLVRLAALHMFTVSLAFPAAVQSLK